MSVLQYSFIDSPIGALTIVTSQKGLCLVEFGKDESNMQAIRKYCQKWGHTLEEEPALEAHKELHQQITQFFEGKQKIFDIQLDLKGTPFQCKVWNALLQIPYGETRSYKQVAEAIGSEKAVRAVGGANNKNPVPIIVPCHRVIGAGGSLVGYGGGLSIKEHLLGLEGVIPVGSK
ncbi:methylated-DNA--[protein]-cysteine S-methyltransferase [Brevibacillus daliensis]|uniref:methylated-DNA--[protein]-cysteine S-methyltransferase n=1 Tax=Brevibacillus daliensis TaxID=2892995 RepID=UPI001E63CA2C|nr:methylated-DNA--[protein]-cysteine S-methyltransferase [Brevibacillus daliensis]